MPTRHLVAATVIAQCLLAASGARAVIELVAADPLPLDAGGAALAVADLNGDGRDDVVAVDPRTGALRVVLAGDGATRWMPAEAQQLAAPLGRVAAGDLDGDGNADVAVAGRRQGVWILRGNGDGTLAAPYAVGAGSDAVDVAIAAVDGGAAELLVADLGGDALVLLGDGASPPGFRLGARVGAGPAPRRIVAADVDRDGRPDLVTLGDGPRVDEIAVHRFRRVAQGLPEYTARWRVTAIDGAVAELLVAELTGDGAPDLVLRDTRAPGRLLLLTDAGDHFAVSTLAVPCPFFTGGLPCPLRGLAVADLNRDNRADLVVALHDPRPRGDGAAAADAVQAWIGRGDGRFVAASVAAVAPGTAALLAGLQSDDCLPDLIAAAVTPGALQVLVNRSRPGGLPNGDACLAGDECLSGRCADGRCCGAACADGERCDVPGHEGRCRPQPLATVPCAGDPQCATVPGQPYCADGVCCDARCAGGRCDWPGFEGLCIPGLADGAPCGDGPACASGVCGPTQRCCREPCDGYCDEGGRCRARHALGAACSEDAECQSGVCDAVELSCCGRRCAAACGADGRCPSAPLTPLPMAAAAPRPRRAAAVACPADCDGDGAVGVAEIVRLINLALGHDVAACGAAAGRRCVAVDDVIRAVGHALSGCG